MATVQKPHPIVLRPLSEPLQPQPRPRPQLPKPDFGVGPWSQEDVQRLLAAIDQLSGDMPGTAVPFADAMRAVAILGCCTPLPLPAILMITQHDIDPDGMLKLRVGPGEPIVSSLSADAIAAVRKLPAGRCLFGDRSVNPRWLGSKICNLAASIGLQGGFAQLRRANELGATAVPHVPKWKHQKSVQSADPTREEIAARAAEIRKQRDGQPWSEGGAE